MFRTHLAGRSYMRSILSYLKTSNEVPRGQRSPEAKKNDDAKEKLPQF